jgi:hypothetical protein
VQLHIPFDLVKELVSRLDVEIESRIGSAQYHHKEIFLTDDKAVSSERRVEVILVRFDPLL